MFALYLCLQLFLSTVFKRPSVEEVIKEEEYPSHEQIKDSPTNVDVNHCQFSKLGNTDENGGAIFINTDNKVNCSIDDCKFNECKGKNGGAIWVTYSKTTDYELSVINSIFTGCTATAKGGAVFVNSEQPLHHTFNISGCTFNNNKASYGGALYAELRDLLNLENCHFNGNEASEKGSSAYLKLGHQNIKNTVEEHDTFKIHNNEFVFNPSSTNTVNVYIENDGITDPNDPAHANVYLGGNTFSLENSQPATSKYLHLEVVENQGLFESFNFDSCNCVHQEQKTVQIAPRLTLSNFNFGCTSINSCTPNVATPTPLPTADVDGYIPHEPIREVTISIEIEKCKFTRLENLEGNGSAILITYSKKVNCQVNDCKFTECKAVNGGAIFAQYSKETNYKFSITNSVFTSCEATMLGGAIYIQSAQPLHHAFNISGCTFNNNKAQYGGALYAELRDQLNLENCHFNGNEASNKGSSAYLKLGHENIKNTVEEHDTFNIHNNEFVFNPSSTNTVNVYIENDGITDDTDPAHANVYLGGNTFSLANSQPATSEYLHLEIVENNGGFESFTFDSCNCVHQEQSTVKVPTDFKYYNVDFECTSIDTCTSDQPTPPPTIEPTPDEEGYKPHEPIRETSINIDVKHCYFNKFDNLGKNGGAILITTQKKVNVSVNDCKFNECKAKNGGAIYAYYSAEKYYEFSIIKTIFERCSSTTRGGAVYIQSAQPKYHAFDFSECTFNNNKAQYGGALYAELRDKLNLENCHFNGNEASNKGSSAYLKLGHENIKTNVEEHDTFKIHNNEFIFNPSSSNTVNVYIENDGITDDTDPAHANVYLGGNTFNIESSTRSTNEYLHLEIVENTGGFESFNFDSCNCVHQEQSTVKVPSSINLHNIDFGCTSIDTCTSNQPVQPTPPDSGSDNYQPHDPIRETTIHIDVKNCLFNKFDNLENNGGAILITTSKKVNVSISNCKFNECKAANGGAIWARYSERIYYEFSIIKTIFEGCSSTTRGGAVYVQSAQPVNHTFYFSECTFNNNKAVYGGGLYAELRDQLNLEKCYFNNNEASYKGSSAYLKLGHENIRNKEEEHDIFNIHNNVFIFNPYGNNTINVFIENDEITDESDPAHANVYLGGNTFLLSNTNPQASEYLHLKVVENNGGFESFNFDSCNCVHQDQNTVNVDSKIAITNIDFGCTSIDKCTSDQAPIKPTDPPTPDTDGFTPHEPIKLPSTKIEIEKSKFNSMGSLTANGGAILMTFSKKVNCTINDCKFNECKGKNGGAISASYSSTTDYGFKISKTSFSSCKADSKGGSVYIFSAQPLHHAFNISGCTFSNCKSYEGGALYAELRDQLNLENCHFSGNEASNKGSSAYLKLGHENIKNNVEEHDTFNIHNNEFVFNPSSTNTVNVYIENDGITDPNDPAHVNVYLGGCTFSTASQTLEENQYLHLQFEDNDGGFESVTFDSCICVKQGQETVKLLSNSDTNNFHFGCESIDKCTPSVIDSSSSSVNDKDVDPDGSSSNHKSKVGLAVGISVAAVVVVVIIVIVVIFVLRKRSSGKYVDVRTDDIADNLNESGVSSATDMNTSNL